MNLCPLNHVSIIMTKYLAVVPYTFLCGSMSNGNHVLNRIWFLEILLLDMSTSVTYECDWNYVLVKDWSWILTIELHFSNLNLTYYVYRLFQNQSCTYPLQKIGKLHETMCFLKDLNCSVFTHLWLPNQKYSKSIQSHS